jgi:hypothetical protein
MLAQRLIHYCGNLVAILAGVILLSSAAAQAGVLESRFGRYLLLETREGSELVASILGPQGGAGRLSRQEMLARVQERLKLPEFATQRAALETRVQEALSEFEFRAKGIKRSLEGKLLPNRHERKILDSIAQDLNASQEFIELKSVANFKNSKEAFTSDEPGQKLFDPESSIPVSERPYASRESKRYLEKLKTCMRNPPAGHADSMRTRYILTQLLFDESIAAGGIFVAAGGIEDIDYKSLPSDLFFTAVASTIDSTIVARGGRFSLRWYKLIAASPGEAGLDITFYQITHSPNHHESGERLSSGQRFAFNSIWGAAYAPVAINLFNLVAGLECADTNAAIVLGVRGGVGVLGAATYYSIRKGTVNVLK